MQYSAILTAFFLGIALFIAGWWYHGAIVLGALVTGMALFVLVRLASCPVLLRVPLLSSHRLYHTFHQKFPDLETAEIRRMMFRQKASQGSLFHRK